MLQTCAAIHDLSCYAKSSLTVVLPVLEAMGIETCPLPTAILSSQTDGFDTYYFRDTSKDMQEIITSWNRLSLQFDAVYSGFLGSEGQVELIVQFIEHQRMGASPFVLVDPVLGDDASLYGPISVAHVEAMKRLVKKADVITPNTTEAALLLNLPYQEQFLEEQALLWARKLSLQTGAEVAITSVPLAGGCVVACSENDTQFLVPYTKVDASFPGCGDLFASLLLGSLLSGQSYRTAVEQAVSYTSLAIERTVASSRERRRGISPTIILPDLVRGQHHGL
ncbi:MAG: pyridoxamine kinase [Sphaerochaeta sp.]